MSENYLGISAVIVLQFNCALPLTLTWPQTTSQQRPSEQKSRLQNNRILANL